MSAAFIALLGVVIGGLLTAVLNYLLEARRNFLAARMAARLVVEELKPPAIRLRSMLKHDSWLYDPKPPFGSAAVWTEYRQTLALGLSWYEWSAVSFAYSQLAAANDQWESNGKPRGKPLSATTRAIFETVLVNVEHGQRSLERVTVRSQAGLSWDRMIRRLRAGKWKISRLLGKTPPVPTP